MSAPDGAEAVEPGTIRLAYRRLTSAAGLADLPELEHRVAQLADDIAETRALEAALVELVGRVEASLVPVLEIRVRRHRRDQPDVP